MLLHSVCQEKKITVQFHQQNHVVKNMLSFYKVLIHLVLQQNLRVMRSFKLIFLHSIYVNHKLVFNIWMPGITYMKTSIQIICDTLGHFNAPTVLIFLGLEVWNKLDVKSVFTLFQRRFFTSKSIKIQIKNSSRVQVTLCLTLTPRVSHAVHFTDLGKLNLLMVVRF